jgi:ABC-type branched-subunit amino acid transport system ATPase component
MMVIEHNLDFVSDLCAEIVVLDFGEVIAQGPPRTVLRDERVRNAYMGGYEAVAREQSNE